MRPDWFLSTRLQALDPYYGLVKRLTDLTLGVIGILVSLPFLLIAAILVRLESPGPALYSQIRVGRNNETFRIYKLRSMAQDAERSGAKWASKGDARVTRIGKILRKTRLDELPQFWNILKGEMSFIGPRPERPEFTEDLSNEIPFYEKRHLVKPGLTGWAQINYPYGASVEDARNKLRYDLYYVKYASPELDLHIIIRTIGAIMKGAR